MTGSDVAELAKVGFDYSQLDAKVAAQAKASAHQINTHRRKITASLLEIGAILRDMKAVLGHGHFLTWLSSETIFEERTAQNYMGAAERLGAKSATVSDLMPSTVFALASPSLSDDVRASILERKEAGNITERDVKDLIWEAKQAAKTERVSAKLTPDQRKRQKLREDRQEREWQKRRDEQEAEAAARQDAREKAVEMVRVMLGTGGLPGFLRLLEKAGQLSFSDFD